ncbi:HSP70 family protein [Aspergillus fumigatus Z5]|nr:HSP70 family protein [Aspergillus fumigatus Z5]
MLGPECLSKELKDFLLSIGWKTLYQRLPIFLLTVSIYVMPTVGYIAKGKRYALNHTATQDLVVPHRAGDSLLKTSNIYGCNDANAPQRVDHPGVDLISQLMCDFAGVELAQFPQSRTGTQVEYLLSYSIEITFGARGVLKCKAVCQGRTVGETTVQLAREQW